MKSKPLKFRFGLYESILLDITDTEPLFATAEIMLKASPSTSESFANANIFTEVSSLIVWLSMTASGSSFTGIIVKLTFALAEP